MTTATESTVYKVDDIIQSSVDAWNKHTAAVREYAKANAAEVDQKFKTSAEFKAYADALTDIIRPYTYAKTDSKLLTDPGIGDLHGYRYPELTMSPFFGGFGQTEVGAIDYYAASIVDPKFIEKSRERTALWDQSSGRGLARYYDPGTDKQENTGDKKYSPTVLDHARGAYASFGTSYDAGLIGAGFRLRGEMKRDFKKIMADPVKADAVTKIRDLIRSEFTKASEETLSTYAGRQTMAADPGHNNGEQLLPAQRAAYVKWLGFETIEGGKDEPIAKVVDRVVKAAEYAKDGRAAPAFGALPAPKLAEVDAVLEAFTPAKAVAPFTPLTHNADDEVTRKDTKQKIQAFVNKAQQLANG